MNEKVKRLLEEEWDEKSLTEDKEEKQTGKEEPFTEDKKEKEIWNEELLVEDIEKNEALPVSQNDSNSEVPVEGDDNETSEDTTPPSWWKIHQAEMMTKFRPDWLSLIDCSLDKTAM